MHREEADQDKSVSGCDPGQPVSEVVALEPDETSGNMQSVAADGLVCRRTELFIIGAWINAISRYSCRVANDDATPRQRLLSALAASITEVGYRETTVTDIVQRARTSRRTFYDHFADREACLVALLTNMHQQALRSISAGVDPGAPWEVQIRQAVQSWIAYAEKHSPVILTWIREAPAFGPAARQFQHDVTDAYIQMIQKFSDTAFLRAAGHRKVPRHRAVMFVGGLREMSALAIESGDGLRAVTEGAVDAALSLFSLPAVGD